MLDLNGVEAPVFPAGLLLLLEALSVLNCLHAAGFVALLLHHPRPVKRCHHLRRAATGRLSPTLALLSLIGRRLTTALLVLHILLGGRDSGAPPPG